MEHCIPALLWWELHAGHSLPTARAHRPGTRPGGPHDGVRTPTAGAEATGRSLRQFLFYVLKSPTSRARGARLAFCCDSRQGPSPAGGVASPLGAGRAGAGGTDQIFFVSRPRPCESLMESSTPLSIQQMAFRLDLVSILPLKQE